MMNQGVTGGLQSDPPGLAGGFDWPAIRRMVTAEAYFERYAISDEEQRRRLVAERLASFEPVSMRGGASHVRKLAKRTREDKSAA
jgi:hypothetical protein